MKNKNIIFFVGLVYLSIFFGCTTETKITKPVECTGITWTHNGPSGATHWVDLCSGFSACGGQRQSPLNITGAENNNTLSAITFNYKTTTIEIENNGHTIEFLCQPGSKITINGTVYDLLQFHYHGSSEHTVEGVQYPLEVHFVHKATDSNYAVLGILFEEGAENPLFTSFLSHFPKQVGIYKDDLIQLDLTSLFPTNKSYYNYSGSLTTPPCSEVVNWYVFKNKVTASAAQLSVFRAILKNNFRPVQNLNGRKISSFDQLQNSN